MKKILLFLVIIMLTQSWAAGQGTDVITLKNGSVIRGRIIEQNEQLVKVYTTNRSMVELKPSEIDSIGKESTSQAPQDLQTSFDDEDVTTQGNMIVGGSAWLGYDKYKYNDGTSDSEFGLSLKPTVAWFVIDYLAVGAGLNLGLGTSSGDFTYSLGIGPLIKYYLDAGLFFSAQATFNMDHYPNKVKYTRFSIKPGVGYAIFLNSKVALEPAITYEFNSQKYKSEFANTTTKRNSIGIEMGFTIFM